MQWTVNSNVGKFFGDIGKGVPIHKFKKEVWDIVCKIWMYTGMKKDLNGNLWKTMTWKFWEYRKLLLQDSKRVERYTSLPGSPLLRHYCSLHCCSPYLKTVSPVIVTAYIWISTATSDTVTALRHTLFHAPPPPINIKFTMASFAHSGRLFAVCLMNLWHVCWTCRNTGSSKINVIVFTMNSQRIM